jgi:hypothetical protein
MIRLSSLLVFSLSFVAVVLLVHSASVTSQSVSSETQLSKVIQDMRAAELSGATPDEIRELAVQLNALIGLQDALQGTSPQDLGRRTQLSEQINNTLTRVDMQSDQLATRAAERTSVNHLVAYSAGVVGAVAATVVYHYGTLLWRRYRVKRTFQLNIIPKKMES